MTRLRLPWPLPALLTWALAWALFVGLRSTAMPDALALAGAAGIGALAALWGATRWRRIFIAGGFPLSVLAAGVAAGAWVWLLPLAGLALLYPVRSWRDAPMFPTPRGALRGLSSFAALPARARVLDAGCGLGDGLRELQREYPQATVEGIEWSWPLRLACGLRCRFANVTRGDIWAADWSGHDLVYLFQRPESMPRAVRKAARELRPGAWLASLEFEAAALVPAAVHRCADGRPVWLYQVPFKAKLPR